MGNGAVMSVPAPILDSTGGQLSAGSGIFYIPIEPDVRWREVGQTIVFCRLSGGLYVTLAKHDRGEKPPGISGNPPSLGGFFMKFRGRNAHPNRVEKPPLTSGNPLCLARFFMKFRGRKAHSNRPRKAMVCPTKRPTCLRPRLTHTAERGSGRWRSPAAPAGIPLRRPPVRGSPARAARSRYLPGKR